MKHREEKEERLPSMAECGLLLLTKAVPSMAAVFLWYAVGFASLAVVGATLGPHTAAGCSLGFFTMSLVVLYPGMGLTFAVDTLCAQIHGRAPDSPRQGEVVQRSFLVTTAFLAPMSLLLLYSDRPMAMLFEEHLARTASAWLRWAPVYLEAQLLSQALGKFLSNMLQPHWNTIALLAAAVVSPVATWVLCPLYGPAGSAMAVGLGGCVQLLCLAFIIARDPRLRNRFGPWRGLVRLTEWQQLRAHLGLALPSMCFVVAEGAAFDVTVLLAGHFGADADAAWSNVLTVLLMAQSVSAGLSIAATSLVGGAVGAGRKAEAKRYAVVASLLAGGIALVNSGVVLWWHRFFFGLLGSNAAVRRIVGRLLWLIAPFHLCDCVQFVFQGIFAGAGRTGHGAKALLASLWLIGMPTSLLLMQWFDVVGVVAGLTVGLAVEIPTLMFVCVRFFDWEPHDDGDDGAPLAGDHSPDALTPCVAPPNTANTRAAECPSRL